MKKRTMLIRRARKGKKICTTLGIVCGCISFLLMGGVDGENWVAVTIAMVLFMLAAFVAGIGSEYFSWKVRELRRPSPWERGGFLS